MKFCGNFGGWVDLGGGWGGHGALLSRVRKMLLHNYLDFPCQIKQVVMEN